VVMCEGWVEVAISLLSRRQEVLRDELLLVGRTAKIFCCSLVQGLLVTFN
jgi:hypothetical protein